MLNINHLSISWSVSRGRDTYGYNICRLDDRNNGKRYRTCGGGYDMVGTVFGAWLQDVYQERLQEFCDFHKDDLIDCCYSVGGYFRLPNLYGLTLKVEAGGKTKVTLDGACGIESMRRIAEAIGLEVQWEGNRKGHTIGYFVQDNRA